nr:unnamed protein product [Spirometra erinaceieuropaei]
MTEKSARDDRKQYWAEIATSTKQASNFGDTRKLYQLIRQVSGKPYALSDSVRDVKDNFTADNSSKSKRWHEHFECHFNFDTQSTTPLFSPAAESPPPPTYALSGDPLVKKSPMPYKGYATTRHRSCVDTLAPWLHELTQQAWRDEVSPDDRDSGILVTILKKGDKTRCENYRDPSLIDFVAKILAIFLLRRFQAVRATRTRPNQAGFRARCGYANHVFTLRRILKFSHSYQRPTAVCFVDFAAAFDSVRRGSLWWIMALDGVSPKILTMVKASCRSTGAQVMVHNNLSQPFGIRSGV